MNYAILMTPYNHGDENIQQKVSLFQHFESWGNVVAKFDNHNCYENELIYDLRSLFKIYARDWSKLITCVLVT